ncbi:MAG TPA: ABC transporter substrate-binding protein [Alphaproteobacteria bacterium]|nr:ABC transporter substrate-binding protein [Alphaproteobacteria bacterium]
MRRRNFITILGGAALAWPLAARAQQKARLPTIGFLIAGTPADTGDWVTAFLIRLHELGWVENRDVAIEYRWGEGRTERYAELAAEFVRLKVDVIVTYGTATVQQVKQATASIPIVFALAGDPVGTGLVASLARPGGNVTGLSIQQVDSAPKRLELLREIVPGVGRLAIMGNVGNPSIVLEMDETRDLAKSLGLETTALEIRRPEDIAPAIAAIKGKTDALYITGEPMLQINRKNILALAADMRLPTMCNNREWAAAGCLMSYGPNFPDLFRRAAECVDKILHGAKPAEIPVEQPTKFDLVVNLTTAKALGLKVPPIVLGRADEVIE